MIVPTAPDEYRSYTKVRGPLAIPADSLLPIAPIHDDGRSWALHPSLLEMRDLFASGQLAFIANVGTLVAPLTRAEYLAKSVAAPTHLFSHNHQQVSWQSSQPDSQASSGWAGRIADIWQVIPTQSRTFFSISLAGNNLWQVGKEVTPFQVGPGISIGLGAYENTGQDAKWVNAYPKSQLDESTYRLFPTVDAKSVRQTSDYVMLLQSALASAPRINTVFPSNNRLADQLKMIARLISIRQVLGCKRQLFFCSLGGWDTHRNQLDIQAILLSQVSQAVRAFYEATVELGVGDVVTLFSASDFGRSYAVNCDGTDHGWGSHHFVCGGAVRGGAIYGRMPLLSINGPDDTSQGRWIPSVSVDEYSATLARWFGMTDGELEYLLPNLGRFATRDLGFLS